MHGSSILIFYFYLIIFLSKELFTYTEGIDNYGVHNQMCFILLQEVIY